MLNNLQILRAAAAINVVLFHAIVTAWSYNLDVKIFANMRGWGGNGVDIFFVISGFVMVLSQSRNPKSARQFFANRVLRIVPFYWALTSAIVVLYWLSPGLFRNLQLDMAQFGWSILFLSGLVGGQEPLLTVGWTLEYEMLFYLLFSFGLLLRNKLAAFLFPIICLLLLVVFAGANTIVIEFILGMFAAKLYQHGVAKSAALPLLITGTLLLFSSLYFTVEADRVLVWGLPSLLIVYGASGMPQIKTGLLTYLGAASYSIYLIQFFSIPVFYKISTLSPITLSPDFLIIMCTLATTVAGCIVHSGFEKPITKLLKSVFQFMPTKTHRVGFYPTIPERTP